METVINFITENWVVVVIVLAAIIAFWPSLLCGVLSIVLPINEGKWSYKSFWQEIVRYDYYKWYAKWWRFSHLFCFYFIWGYIVYIIGLCLQKTVIGLWRLITEIFVCLWQLIVRGWKAI